MDRRRRSTGEVADGGLAGHLDRAGSSLLTAAQEVELATEIEVGLLARDRLARDGCASDGRDLALLVERGERAMARMVAANLRLVVMVARGHRTPGVALTDLVQEGTVGLVRAVQRFDFRRGVKFSTYAVWWIRQAVQRASAELGRAVRLPVVANEQLRMLHAASHRLQVAGVREPSVRELAAATGLATDQVRHLQGHDGATVALDEPRASDHPLHRQLSAPDGLAELGHAAVRRARLDDALSVLSEAERAVVERRYGFIGPAASARSVGVALGVTESQVRTIERRALDRLRAHPALHAVG